MSNESNGKSPLQILILRSVWRRVVQHGFVSVVFEPDAELDYRGGRGVCELVLPEVADHIVALHNAILQR